MWYEHGQSERMINLDHIISIQMSEQRNSLRLKTVMDVLIVLRFEDEAEASEAYQVLRANLKLRLI